MKLRPGVKATVVNLSERTAQWGSNDNPNGILEMGKEYTVRRVEVFSSFTKVTLEEFPDKKFNSCHFEPYQA